MDRFTPSRRSPPALPWRHHALALGQGVARVRSTMDRAFQAPQSFRLIARAHGPSAVEPTRLERSIAVARTAFNPTSTLTTAQIHTPEFLPPAEQLRLPASAS